jgi:Zn-finger nucleic acid-binding protein
MFVPRDALAELLSRAEISGSLPEPAARVLPPLDAVTYLPCPLCHNPMNRVNFGRVSGVIVDVCRDHGTWFDGGELTRVVAFAGGGGMAKMRARFVAERHEAVALHQGLVDESRARVEERLLAWRDFLNNLF